MERKHYIRLIASAVVVVAAVVFLGGIAGGSVMYHMDSRGDMGPLTREDIVYLDVEAP